MKNSIKYITIVFALVLTALTTSCVETKSAENMHSEDGGHHEENGHHEEEGHHEEGLRLTKEQIETIGLELGNFVPMKVNGFVKATGTLGIPPNAYSSVTAKAEGIIKGTKKYVEGDYIRKGELIAYIENPDFIIIQQEYLEVKAKHQLHKLDLVRQQALVDAKAGVIKKLETSQANLAILEAKMLSLAKQLSYIGISVDNLTPKTLRQQIIVASPMSGYISKIAMHNGMYAQTAASLMEIISSAHLHLELDVFEKDIASIKVGQKIDYSVPALGNTIFKGEVSVMGKEFDLSTKSVRIHGHLEGEKPTFLKGLFINAKIWLNDETIDAVPEGAIILNGGLSYIYVAENEKENEVEFKAISVMPGATNNGFTAIKLLEGISEGMRIVTKGAYYVSAQSKAGELAHEH